MRGMPDASRSLIGGGTIVAFMFIVECVFVVSVKAVVPARSCIGRGRDGLVVADATRQQTNHRVRGSGQTFQFDLNEKRRF